MLQTPSRLRSGLRHHEKMGVTGQLSYRHNKGAVAVNVSNSKVTEQTKVFNP
jgi:hypothetical protein